MRTHVAVLLALLLCAAPARGSERGSALARKLEDAQRQSQFWLDSFIPADELYTKAFGTTIPRCGIPLISMAARGYADGARMHATARGMLAASMAGARGVLGSGVRALDLLLPAAKGANERIRVLQNASVEAAAAIGRAEAALAGGATAGSRSRSKSDPGPRRGGSTAKPKGSGLERRARGAARVPSKKTAAIAAKLDEARSKLEMAWATDKAGFTLEPANAQALAEGQCPPGAPPEVSCLQPLWEAGNWLLSAQQYATIARKFFLKSLSELDEVVGTLVREIGKIRAQSIGDDDELAVLAETRDRLEARIDALEARVGTCATPAVDDASELQPSRLKYTENDIDAAARKTESLLSKLSKTGIPFLELELMVFDNQFGLAAAGLATARALGMWNPLLPVPIAISAPTAASFGTAKSALERFTVSLYKNGMPAVLDVLGSAVNAVDGLLPASRERKASIDALEASMADLRARAEETEGKALKCGGGKGGASGRGRSAAVDRGRKGAAAGGDERRE